MKYPLPSLLLVGTALLANPARAATMILHNFVGGDGAHPYGSLTLSGSKLYGMTNDGALATDGLGTLFAMNTDGTGYTVLHSFAGAPSDGRNPYGAVTIAGSKLYGMTNTGGTTGSGTIFAMNTDGSGYSLLRSFNSPGPTSPAGSLVLSGSKLYGMTDSGGTANSGTIFSMNTDGTGFRRLHIFIGGATDGMFPDGDLTLVGSKLYGMTPFGGSSDGGVIFSLNIDGTGYTALHTFTGGASGFHGFGSLTVFGAALYGMTAGGGSSNGGALFRFGTDGTGFSLLHSFTGGTTDGSSPSGSLALSGSVLYGMTNNGGAYGNGTLFNVNTDGTGYGILEDFRGFPTDGAFPLFSSPTVAEDGSTIYGMTRFGGTSNSGVVFSRAVVPEPGTIALLSLGGLLLSARRRNARA